jgi:ATP-dependent Clp protease adaptor protein ClpS
MVKMQEFRGFPLFRAQKKNIRRRSRVTGIATCSPLARDSVQCRVGFVALVRGRHVIVLGPPERRESDPLTAREFYLHNGLTMLRRFDPSLTAADQPTRFTSGPRRPLKSGPDDDRKDGGGSKTGADTILRPKLKPKTQKPSLYRVLLLNDDYTPMEFVILVLQDVFNKTREEATRIMFHVHEKGVGECGIYPYEVAETKVTRVMDTARKNQHPLQCVMEKQ